MKAHQKAFSRFLSACFVHTLLRLFASMQGVIITPPSLWFLSFCLRLCVCSHETTGFWLKRNNLCSDSRDTQQTPLKFRWPAISQCLSYTHTRTDSQSYTWKGRNFLSRKIRSAELCWILFYTRLSLCATRGYLCIVFSCFCYICLFFAFWDSHLITIIITVHNPPD